MEQPTDNEYTDAVAVLMRAPLGRFTAVRTEMVRTLQKDDMPELAKRIAAVRKPSVALWALNQAGQMAGDDLEQLRSAGDRLREAQERLLKGDRSAGETMSEATHEQRSAIDVLSRRLGMALTAAGHGTSAETLRRIADGLRSASIGDPETWSALRAGRLLSEPEPVSFAALDITQMKLAADALSDHAAEAHGKQLAAAEADVRRAEELERAAEEQDQAARTRREQATEALKAARAALTKLHRES